MLIVIQLPDGRERAIRRSATGPASEREDEATTAGRQAHISVRTLLPLANHVRTVLPAPYQVPALTTIHKSGDVAGFVPLKDIPNARLTRDEEDVA